jgi:hypothetical protein
MFRELKLTLYDIFGYVLPGIVLLAGLLVLLWSLTAPIVPLQLTVSYSWELWTVALLAAYFLGHAAQAICNVCHQPFRALEESVLSQASRSKCPAPILDAVCDVLRKQMAVEPSELDGQWIFRVCNELITQKGRVEDREMYTYREGFYRGSSVALVILSLSLVVRGIEGSPAAQVSGLLYTIPRSAVYAASGVCAVMAALFIGRQRRFTRYRILHVVLGSLALRDS